ncbi:autotransporter-associated beta strand repeat-containing protein [Posidoniimonas corsicana]|uniref:autotransporter-associated beta strand repeat-containing protein n=1 Tax=Posidoniimonas corsicana TaxID=1938618 RepID=UPI001E2FEE53|nr:autotransporter-associated beta strand repeat-containing protein [Posidoniimonas corsicana]
MLITLVASCSQASAQLVANSLAELRSYGTSVDNTTVVLSGADGDPHPETGVVTPGHYWINGDHIANPTSSMPIFMELGGSGNTYDLSGATINLDTRKLDGFGRSLGHDSGVDVVRITGSGNTVRGLTLIGQDIALDTDPDAQRFADWATQYVELSGANNTVDGAHVVSRGSRTDAYGLGDAFGKGASQGVSPYILHRKASAFRVGEATNAVINDMHLEAYAFGHGFFVQNSTNTTLTNSTVTGELFSSQGVVEHPLYQQHGHTWWGEPIPDDIMISGAEGGVRVYGGASGLTVDNVVVTNMRTGFATVHDGGAVNISNSYAYGTQSGFDVGDNTTITNSGGDIANGPLLVFYGSGGNNSIELELVGGDPVGVDWSPAFVNGVADVSITSSLPAGALPEQSVIRLGQSYYQNWRNFDYTTDGPESGDPTPYTNSTFHNNTHQILVLGENAVNNTGSSVGMVITNGKENYYDGVSLVPAGKRTLVSHAAGLGNNGAAAEGTLDSNASVVQLGGTLELQPGVKILNEKLTISGDGVDGQGALYSDGRADSGTRFGSSSRVDESVIVLDGNASIGVGVAGNQLLVGTIQGTGNLTKRGPGKLSIERPSTLAGNLTIAEGQVTARSGVVRNGLTVAAGASIDSIGADAINTGSAVLLYGRMDVNARSDANQLSARVGQLFGSGVIEATNPTADNAGTLTVETSSGQGYFIGEIQGGLSLVKSGAGEQVLAGVNTYTGSTTISNGLLRVDGTHTGGAHYAVLSGGVLGGVGEIGSDVVVQAGGTLAPGSSAGELRTRDVEFHRGAVLAIEVSGATAGTDYDLLAADEILLGGQLAVTLIGDGFTPAFDDVFTVVSAASLSGAFDNVADGSRLNTTDGEGSFIVSYSSELGVVTLNGFLFAGLAGDFNADGVVDAADYSVWRDNLGALDEDSLSGNGSNSGGVDAADYELWRSNFGAMALDAAHPAYVPEPTFSGVLAVVCWFLAHRRRQLRHPAAARCRR